MGSAGTEADVDRPVSDAKATMQANELESATAPQHQSLNALEAELDKAANKQKRDIREVSIRAELPIPVAADLRIDRREELRLDEPVAATGLQPNTAYVNQDNVYVTDDYGRAAYARFTPVYTPSPPRHSAQQGAVRLDATAGAGGVDQYVGGHLHGQC